MMADGSTNHIGRILSVVIVPLVVGGAGCGTNFNDLAYQSGAAATRTAADLLLTDFYNAVADAWDDEPESLEHDDAADSNSDDGDAVGEDDNHDDDGHADDGPQDPPSGNADNGMIVYADNGCGRCHCDDAGGGCALSAPSITSVALDHLDEHVRGDAPHPIAKLDLSDEELNDLHTYLSGL